MGQWDVVSDEPADDGQEKKPSKNPWAVVEEVAVDAPLRLNVMSATGRNPATVAEADKLARRHQAPVETVERNMDDFRRQTEADDASEMASTHPRTAEWLRADPDNAAVARGDWGALKALETLFKATPLGGLIGSLTSNTGRSAAAGAVGLAGSGVEGIGEIPGLAERRMTGGVTVKRSAGEQRLRDMFGMDVDISGGIKRAAKSAGGALNTLAEDVDVPDSEKTWVDQIAAGGGSALAGFGLAALNPLAGAALWSGAGIDVQADRARESGTFGTEKADTAMAVGGVVTSITEQLGYSWLTRALPPAAKTALATRIGDLLKSGAGEGAQEVTEQLSQDLLTRELVDPSQDIGGYADDAGVGFAVGLLLRGAHQIGKSGVDAREAVAERDALQGLLDATSASSLFKTSPTRFKDAVSSLKSQGMSDVYVPVEAWQTLFQSDPAGSDAAREAAGVTDADFAQALMSGGRIRIPVEGFLTELSSEQQTALAKESRFKPDGFTPPDAEAFDPDEAVAEYFRTAGVGRPAGIVSDVYNEYVSRLTGPYSKVDAEYLAEYVAALTSGYGSRSGMQQEIADLWINNLTVAAEGRIPERLRTVLGSRKDVVPAVDSILDALRANAYPSDADIFGPSLSEWVRSVGGIDPGSVGADWLKAQDANRQGLLRAGGMTVEDALRNAIELGYINKDDLGSLDRYSTDAGEINDMIDAMTQDMSGVRPVYSAQNLNVDRQAFADSMSQAAEELRDRGIDLAKVSNAEARRLMGMADSRGEVVGNEQVYNSDPLKSAAGSEPIAFMYRYVSELHNEHLDSGIMPSNRQAHGSVSINSIDPFELDEFEDLKDNPRVIKMADDIRNGAILPPVLLRGKLDDKKLRPQVQDGHHRVAALQLAGVDTVQFVYDTETLAEIWADENQGKISAKKLESDYKKSLLNSKELAQGAPQTRASVIARAGELGLPLIGKTADIAELIRIAETNPRDWTRAEFDTILPQLEVHQDIRGASADPAVAEAIMRDGLRSGMSDSLEAMVTGKHWTYATSLQAGNAFVFLRGGIKTLSKDNPAFAPGNKPLFMFSPTDGQDPFEAIKATAVSNLPEAPAVLDSGSVNEVHSEYGTATTYLSVEEPKKRRAKGAQDNAGQTELFVADGTKQPILLQETKITQTGEFRSGVKTVKTLDDAAHIFAPLRKMPQEQFMVLALDAKGKPLAVLRHTIGTKNESLVDPAAMFGSVAMIDGVDSVVFGHNHPSGNITPSNADFALDRNLERLMAGSGITIRGAIIVAPQSATYTSYADMQTEREIKPLVRSGSVPVVERSYKKLLPKSRQSISNPISAKRIAAEAIDRDGAGVILLDTRHNVVGYVPVDPVAIGKLRTGNRETSLVPIMRAVAGANASNAILYGESTGEEALVNLGTALGESGVETLDIIVKGADGDLVSFAENGRPTKKSGGLTFYQSQPTEDTLRDQDARWYFSAAVQAVTSSKTNKASGDQWLATIRNTPGVRTEEIDWLGLPEFLGNRKGITRDEIEAYVRSREVVVEDVLYSMVPKLTDGAIERLVRELEYGGYRVVQNPENPQDVSFEHESDPGYTFPAYEINHAWQARAMQVERHMRTGVGYVPYADMTLPGGQVKPGVMLLRFPADAPRGLNDSEIAQINHVLVNENGYSALDADQTAVLRAGGQQAVALLEDMDDRIVGVGNIIRVIKSGDTFTHDHFKDVQNFFAHARFEDRTDAAGNRVLFLLEIQSDWHNRGSKFGYKGRKPQTVYPSQDVMLKAAGTRFEDVSDETHKAYMLSGDRSDYVLVVNRDGSTIVWDRESATAALENDYKFWASDRVRTGNKQGLSDAEWSGLELFMRNVNADALDKNSTIPDAPFKKTWYEVMIKRMIRYAAENGYHSVALPRPEQIPDIEGWGVPYATIKADPNHKYASIVGRYEDEYVRTIKALAKKYGGGFSGAVIFHASDVKFDNFEELFDTNIYKIATASGMSATEALRIGDQARNSLEDARDDEVGDAATMFQFMEWFPEILDDSSDPQDEKRADIYRKAFHATVTSPGFVQVPHDMQDTYETVFERMLAVEVGILADRRPHNEVRSAREIMTVMREQMADMGEGPNGENLTIRNFADSFADMVGDRDDPGDAFMSSAVERAIIETEKHPLTRSSLPVGENKNPSIVLTPRLHMAAMSGLPLFQRNTQDKKRGSLSIMPDGSWVMNLLRARDWSTFLHEGSHVQLEIMRQVDAKLRSVDPLTLTADQVRLLSDHDALLRWMGAATFGDVTVEMHEQFAETFEAYLREGKAPSTALQSVFRKFSAWLKAIYHSLSKLPNAKLNDDIRSIMDRMLATDAEIAEAQSDLSLVPKFATAAEAGMTDDEFDRYQEAARLAREVAFEHEFQRQYAHEKREQQAWYRSERKRIRAEVQVELNEDMTYQAAAFMRRGTMPDGTPRMDGREQVKMDSDVLLNDYGNQFIMRNLSGMYAKNGAHPDVIAPLFGFDSGRSMIEALSNQQPYGAYLAAETERRLTEQYPDPQTDGEAVDRAGAAVNNEYSERVLLREIQQVERRVAGSRPTVASVMRDAARRIIAQTRVMDLKPSKHRMAEQKAGRDAVKALAAGNNQEALVQLRRQMMAGMLFRESTVAKDAAEKQFKYAQGLAKKPAQERLAKAAADYLEQINAILGTFEFRRTTNKEIARRRNLSAWVEGRQEAGDVTAVSVDLLARVEAQATKNWREATVQELADAVEAMRNIEHLAGLKNKLLKARRAADKDDAVDEMLGRVASTLPDLISDVVDDADLTAAQRAAKKIKAGIDDLTRPEILFEILDGGESGPFHDFLQFAQAQAEDAKNALRRRVADQLKALHDGLPDGFWTSMDDKVTVSGVGTTRYTLLAAVLNKGNAGNRQRLRDGGISTSSGVRVEMTDAQVDALPGMLTAAELRYVQGLWDVAESMRPDIEGLQQRMAGVPIEFVDAVPFTVTSADGQSVSMRGGYWPLVYKTEQSSVGDRQAGDDALKIMMGIGVTRAATSKGYTKDRVDELRAPLRLNLGMVLSKNLDEVMTDVAYREAVRDVQGLLSDQRLKTAIISRLGKSAYNSLVGSLAYSVSGSADTVGMSAQSWRDTVDFMMANAAVSALAIRPEIALGNYTSAVIQGMTRVERRAMMRGLRELWLNRKDMTAEIKALSPFMADRLDDLDAHYGKQIATTKKEKGFRAAYFRVMMTLHRMADHDVTRATWYGRYTQERAAGVDKDEAIRIADKTIRTTQTASGRKDLSTYERDAAFKQTRMFMGPMFVIFGQIRNVAGGSGVASDAGSRLALGMNALFFAPAVFALFAGRWPDDDDDDLDAGDWARWVALNCGPIFALQTMPLIREVASAIESVVSGRPVSPRAAPTSQAVATMVKSSESLWKHGQDFADGEDIDYTRLTADLTGVAAPVSGLPASQFRKSSRAVEWLMDNPEASAEEMAAVILYGPPRK